MKKAKAKNKGGNAQQQPKKKGGGGGKPTPPPQTFYCEECTVTVHSQKQWDQHVASEEHKRLVAEREAIMREACVTNSKAAYAGWVHKNTRDADDPATMVFDRRWMEIKGGYLTYSLAPRMPIKGLISLAGAQVERSTGIPGFSPPQSPAVPHLGTPSPMDVYIEGEEGPASLDLGASRAGAKHADPIGELLRSDTHDDDAGWDLGPRTWEFVLAVSGGGLSRDLYLVLPDNDSMREWREYLSTAIARVEDEENTQVSAELAMQSTGAGDAVFEREGGAQATATAYRKPKLEDFALQTTVGRGSFGKVLKVKHLPTDTTYAMKILNKQDVIEQEIIDKVLGERNSLAAVNHPFVSNLQYAFQTPEKLYLITRFFPGGDLAFHLKSKQKFAEPVAQFYSAQIGIALDHLHSKRILYRDLKPANIVLGADGYCVLTDFGMAKRVKADLRSASFCGTDLYMAPEIVAEDGSYSESVDWWSFGALLFEFLTGEPPFNSDKTNKLYRKILEDEVTYPTKEPLSKVARQLVQKLLEKDGAKRLSGVKAIAKEKFFATTDFDKILKKEATPPFVPNLQKSDTRYFAQKYTKMDPQITKCGPNPVAANKEDGFRGFSYPRLSVS